jgi:predicted Zn-dependent protease
MTLFKAKTLARPAVGLLIAFTLFVSPGLSGCKGVRFPNMMSKSQEIDLGSQTAREIEGKNKLITSGPQYDQLQRVAARILPLAKQDYDVPYSVKLIDSKEVNAFSLPGGPIFFYRGLMDLAGTDDEIAAVLGHEATHVVKRHAAKQISDAQAKSIIAQITLGGANSIVQQIAGFGLQVDQLRYSRDDESEADRNGFRYLVTAGYDPNAMARMFRKLQADSGGGGGPYWLQDHPLTGKRIATAQQWAEDYAATKALPQ